MAQPAQVFTGSASGTLEYSVIDNSSAPIFPTLSAGSHLGYDTAAGPIGVAGAVGQGTNTFKNDDVPDFVQAATTILNDGGRGIFIRFKNPA